MTLMKPCIALVLLAVAEAAAAQTVLPEHSEIGFVTRQMGVPVEGRFKRWQATVKLDPRQPQAAQVALVIDTTSLYFPAPDTEAEAAKPTWFHSAQFPQAQFRSTEVKNLGGNRYEVTGPLTIKGLALPVVVPVSLAAAPGALVTASGSFVLKRLPYRLGTGDWADTSLVADEVQVRFRFTLSGLSLP